MRWITGIIIEIDPISILKSYVEDLKKSHAEMDKQIGKLRGTLAELKRKIKENTATMESSMSIAKQAQKNMKNAKGEAQARMKAQVMLKTRKTGRLKDSNRTFQELHNKIEMIYRVLSKMHINCGVLIEDTEDSVEQKEIEWKTIKSAHGAMKSAMSIINGNQDKRAIYEQALDIMANDLDTKVGEMERFMEVSQGFLDGVDLQNGVFEEKGMELLEQWENDADSWLLGDEKSQLIKDSHDDDNELDVDATITAPPGSINYKNLFN
jgi:chromosome segregation ATPase